VIRDMRGCADVVALVRNPCLCIETKDAMNRGQERRMSYNLAKVEYELL